MRGGRACAREGCGPPFPLPLAPPRARARSWRQTPVPPAHLPTSSRGYRCRPSPLPLARSAAMIGQKTLHSFFSAAPVKKRGRSPEPGGDAEVASWELGGQRSWRGEEGTWRSGGRRLWRGVSQRWWPLGRAALAAVGGRGELGDHAPRGHFQKPRALGTPG